jgi:hypothetical protein
MHLAGFFGKFLADIVCVLENVVADFLSFERSSRSCGAMTSDVEVVSSAGAATGSGADFDLCARCAAP